MDHIAGYFTEDNELNFPSKEYELPFELKYWLDMICFSRDGWRYNVEPFINYTAQGYNLEACFFQLYLKANNSFETALSFKSLHNFGFLLE